VRYREREVESLKITTKCAHYAGILYPRIGLHQITTSKEKLLTKKMYKYAAMAVIPEYGQADIDKNAAIADFIEDFISKL
jgi:hypothetical protein